MLEQVGLVVYQLVLPLKLVGVHNVFHVSSQMRYDFDFSHVIDFPLLELSKDLSYEESLVRILAHKVKEL